MIGVDVPLPVVVTQWMLLVGLSLLVIIMYRQLAHMLLLTKASSSGGGRSIGDSIEPFEYWVGASTESKTFKANDRPTLVMLSDPLCSSCGDALLDLERFAETGAARMLRILVLTEIDADLFRSVPIFEGRSLEIGRLAEGLSMRVFRTRVTPFVYMLDHDHKVLAKGSTSSMGEIERLLNGSVRDVATNRASSDV